jgi:starch-binding outer membrane protein, SusD/RagB family
MKNIYKTLLLLSCTLLLFLSSSCEDVLDQESPSLYTEEKFWKTNTDAELGVVAIYDGMQKTYRLKHFLWGEFRADNFIQADNGNSNFTSLVTNSISFGNIEALQWDSFYNMIYRANIAIEKIPTIPDYSKSLLGEAYIIRSYAYFDAIRVWGSVPLFVNSDPNIGGIVRPATSPEIILNDVIIPDMLKAESLISSQPNFYRFSLASVWAFQAKVYMWLKQYEKAKVVLEKIIALNRYSLVTKRNAWRELFLNDASQGGKLQKGSELIMSINYGLEGSTILNSGVYTLFYPTIPQYILSPTLLDKWVAQFPITQEAWEMKYPGIDPPADNIPTEKYGDWRYYESRTIPNNNSPKVVYCSKFNKRAYNATADNTDIVLFRYSDVLLLLAEAENKIADNVDQRQKSIDLVNKIRAARQLPKEDIANYTKQSDVENLILDERQLELLGEGQRWWDLRRANKVKEVLNPLLPSSNQFSKDVDDDRFLFPIFQTHLSNNPLLKQNPGY